MLIKKEHIKIFKDFLNGSIVQVKPTGYTKFLYCPNLVEEYNPDYEYLSVNKEEIDLVIDEEIKDSRPISELFAELDKESTFKKHGFEDPEEFEGEIIMELENTFIGYFISLGGLRYPAVWDFRGDNLYQDVSNYDLVPLKKPWHTSIEAQIAIKNLLKICTDEEINSKLEKFVTPF